MNVSAGPLNGIGIHQCVTGPGIVPGASYTFGGKVRIPAGQARTWEADEPFQVNSLSAGVGRGEVITANAYLFVTAAAPIFPFATVIDNQSGDFIWVTPSDDEP